MNENLTEIVFILDRSGSMNELAGDTIGGYNSFLERQKKEEGEALVTTVLFDDQYELLHDHVDIKKVQPITSKEYYARGMTALLDAIGKTLTEVGHRQYEAEERATPAKTMVVIITDGKENASREYTLNAVKKQVKTQQEKHGWEFIFLGANIDAVQVGETMGISADHSVNYHPDSVGVQTNFAAVSEAASSIRGKSRSLFSGWRKKIDDDYKNRK